MNDKPNTLHMPQGQSRPASQFYRSSTTSQPPRKSAHVAKGHDAVLKALQDGKRKTTLMTLNNIKYVGVIVGRDKFTITLLLDRDGSRVVFYKHGLEHFYGEEAPVAGRQ